MEEDLNQLVAPRIKEYSTEDAPILAAFHKSNAFVRGVRGPLGSGKSTACTMEVLTRSMEQMPSTVDGKRYTRWAIIRNSYPELKTTTIKTWNDWCPAHYGKMVMSSPIRHHIQTVDMDMEILFLALDRPEDIKKLLSLELTGAWVNEAREIPKTIIDTLTGRVGRYPSVSQGGCSWSGIILDTNPPDDQSWWFRLAEEELPDDWQFWSQPSGRSEEAENTSNLPPQYYKRLMSAKDDDWIKVYVDGEYGYVAEGKPVFTNYRDRIHTSPTALAPIPNVPLLLGVDFGLTPAAAIGQRLFDGRWLIIDEFVTEDSGIPQFAEDLAMYVASTYPEHEVGGGWGDPSGSTRNSENNTGFDLMNEYFPLDMWGTKWKEAPSNDLLMRFEAVRHPLNRLVDGSPGMLISPKCKVIRKGFISGYHYKYLRAGDGEQTQAVPNKNRFSHVMEALQYLVLGGGGHHVVMRKVDRTKFRKRKPTVVPGINYKIFR